MLAQLPFRSEGTSRCRQSMQGGQVRVSEAHQPEKAHCRCRTFVFFDSDDFLHPLLHFLRQRADTEGKPPSIDIFFLWEQRASRRESASCRIWATAPHGQPGTRPKSIVLPVINVSRATGVTVAEKGRCMGHRVMASLSRQLTKCVAIGQVSPG